MPTESINRCQIPKKNLREVLYVFGDRKPQPINHNTPPQFRVEQLAALLKRHAKHPHTQEYHPDAIRDLKDKINFMLDFNRSIGTTMNIL